MRSHSLFLMLILAACGHASPARDSAVATRAGDTAVLLTGPAAGRPFAGGTLRDVDVDGSDGGARFRAEYLLPTTVQDSGVDAPRLVRVGKQSVLHLPPRMMAALRSALPGFQTFRRADYSPAIRDTIYGDPVKEAQFAAIGDFDGNGRLDVALYGQDTSVVLVAVVDGADGVRVFEIERDQDVHGPPVEAHLTYRAAGTLHGVDGPPLRVDHDFFSLEHEYSAGIYYYKNGSFVSRIFGD